MTFSISHSKRVNQATVCDCRQQYFTQSIIHNFNGRRDGEVYSRANKFELNSSDGSDGYTLNMEDVFTELAEDNDDESELGFIYRPVIDLRAD